MHNITINEKDNIIIKLELTSYKIAIIQILLKALSVSDTFSYTKFAFRCIVCTVPTTP